jgi:hypothetical protein
MGFGLAVHRPLIATTGSRCSDPEGWKRARVSRDELLRLLPTIHEREVELFRMRQNADEHYAVEKAYRNARGDRLLVVTTADVKEGYGTRLLVHVTPGGDPRIVAEGVSVLDAGDYDGDGRSEVVAMAAGAEGGTIMLFSDDFAQQARFDWVLRDEQERPRPPRKPPSAPVPAVRRPGAAGDANQVQRSR